MGATGGAPRLIAVALLVLVCAGVADAANCTTFTSTCPSGTTKRDVGDGHACAANCTVADCCRANCTTFTGTCTAPLLKRLASDLFTCGDHNCTASDCCVGSCQTFNVSLCDAERFVRGTSSTTGEYDRCLGNTCVASSDKHACCTKTCVDYTDAQCTDDGYTAKLPPNSSDPTMASNGYKMCVGTMCSSSYCCSGSPGGSTTGGTTTGGTGGTSPSMTCHTGYYNVNPTCPSGLKKRDSDDQHACSGAGGNCTQAECCRPTCALWNGTCPTAKSGTKVNEECGWAGAGANDECNESKCCQVQCMTDTCDTFADESTICKIRLNSGGVTDVCGAQCEMTATKTPAELDTCATCVLANAGSNANGCYDCIKCYATENGIDDAGTKLVWGSVKKPGEQAPAPTVTPTPAPLAKAPIDTKHFVEVDVTMPYTVEQFNTAAVKTSFKKAVAAAAGTVPDNVVIVSVVSARRRNSSVVVKTKILAKDAASVTTMKSTLGSGDALKTKLNTALKNEGLKESTGVTAPATGSTAARSTSSTAQMLVAALSLTVAARM